MPDRDQGTLGERLEAYLETCSESVSVSEQAADIETILLAWVKERLPTSKDVNIYRSCTQHVYEKEGCTSCQERSIAIDAILALLTRTVQR